MKVNIVKNSIVIWLVHLVVLASSGNAATPEVSNVLVTDVTPVSFSVIWSSSEACTSNVNIFMDEEGNEPATGVTIVSQPVKNGEMSIAIAAEGNGVMKVFVGGLEQDTTYYYQTVTTSKSSGHITYHPESAPMIQVTTASRASRTEVNANLEVPFTNDLILQDCYLPDGVTPAHGSLIVAYAEGAYYPVSNFMGDGVASPQCYVDLNNLFDPLTLENKPLYGGEWLLLTRFMGLNGIEMAPFEIPVNDQLAEMKPPQATLRCLCDFDKDGDVDGDDLARFIADAERDDCNGDCPADFNGDRKVDAWDLQLVVPDFGSTECAPQP